MPDSKAFHYGERYLGVMGKDGREERGCLELLGGVSDGEGGSGVLKGRDKVEDVVGIL